MTDLTQYIPHGIVTALGAVVAYVFKKHDERDDARFDKVGAALAALNDKLDTARDKQAENHAEILGLFIQHKKD